MADMTRGERTEQLFAQVISNPTKKYTIANLMESLNIPDTERRNVQRDMRFLSEMDAGRYIQQESIGRTYYYSSALQNADRLLFPNFENTMLHFVFLRRIANIYPATSEIITQLLERIEDCLPAREKKSLRMLGEELNSKILFMGTPPDFEEDSSEKIRVILQAIHDHRKIEVEYITEMSGQEPKLENIEIEFDSHVRLFLEENPFNRSMRIYNGKTGKILAKLKAENNRLLFNWVVSFANAAKVMKPAALQDKLNEYADFLKEVYGKN